MILKWVILAQSYLCVDVQWWKILLKSKSSNTFTSTGPFLRFLFKMRRHITNSQNHFGTKVIKGFVSKQQFSFKARTVYLICIANVWFSVMSVWRNKNSFERFYDKKGQEMFTQLTQKISVAVIYLVMQQVWKAAANLFQ